MGSAALRGTDSAFCFYGDLRYTCVCFALHNNGCGHALTINTGYDHQYWMVRWHCTHHHTGRMGRWHCAAQTLLRLHGVQLGSGSVHSRRRCWPAVRGCRQAAGMVHWKAQMGEAAARILSKAASADLSIVPSVVVGLLCAAAGRQRAWYNRKRTWVK
eukprot:1152509-Pelagomonas_calceolata.AAC.4